MKKITAFAVFFILLLVTQPLQAQYTGLSDHSEPGLKFSVFYNYTRGDFEPQNGEEELELICQLSGARVDLVVFEKLQFYGIVGKSFIDLADSEPEDGTVYGAGVQYLLEPGDPYYIKLTGSVLEHEAQDYNNSADQFEITNDWQAGVIIGQKIEQQLRWGETEVYDAYFGGIYNTREFKSDYHADKYELEELSGASLIAGIKYSLTDYLLFEGQGQLGAEEGIGVRFIYRWR